MKTPERSLVAIFGGRPNRWGYDLRGAAQFTVWAAPFCCPSIDGEVPGSAPTASPWLCEGTEALREAGLHDRLARSGAIDAGVVLPGRYVDDGSSAVGQRVRNQDGLIDAPGAVGVQVTVFDPDNRYAHLLTEILDAGLRKLAHSRPSASPG